METYLQAHLDAIIDRNREAHIAFLQDLVRAKSANPFTPDTSDPDEPIERDVAVLIHDRLREIGLAPEFKGVTRMRPNVVATLPGLNGTNGGRNGGGRSLILNGHMDTVMPSSRWTMDPFGAVVRSGRLYGLGALDMKASLSIFVFAAQALIEAGVQLGGDLHLTFVVDEEPGAYSNFGSAYLLDNGLHATAAIVAEPMNDNVTTGHRGGYRFRLTVHGEAAHTGLLAWERGEVGCNAITAMTQAIRALQDLPIPYTESPAFPERKPVLTFPTMIHGGVSINAVPDRCAAYGDLRLLPGLDAAGVEALIHRRLAAIPNLQYTLEPLMFVPAVEIPPSHDLIQILVRHAAAVTDTLPSTLGCGPWNDGWMFITRGIPAICGFGPNGAGVHAPDEYVELDSLIDTTRIFIRAIVDYLGVW
ncbi:MAG: M20 family metallopeptidase [Anaerolineae bacterium]|nr:M20 family metallopeptidase [Anaerolineae bacterium]